MKNRRALFLMMFSSSLLGFTAFACGDDDSSTFKNNTAVDAAAGDSDLKFTTDSGSLDAGPGNPSCNPQLPATFKANFDVPAATNACSTQQISDYYDNCLAVGDAGAKVKDQSCLDWLSANMDCGNCIEQDETDTTSGPIQLFQDRLYYGINNGGCIAIAQGKSDSTSCGYNYDVSIQCSRESCAGCFDNKHLQSGVSFSNFTDCENRANQGSCKPFDTQSDNACGGYKDAGSSLSAVQCFPMPANEALKPFYTRVMGVFCNKQ